MDWRRHGRCDSCGACCSVVTNSLGCKRRFGPRERCKNDEFQSMSRRKNRSVHLVERFWTPGRDSLHFVQCYAENLWNDFGDLVSRWILQNAMGWQDRKATLKSHAQEPSSAASRSIHLSQGNRNTRWMDAAPTQNGGVPRKIS